MAEEAKKLKTDKKNIESSKSLYENKIEKLVHRETRKFINLFHKSFYEFHENTIKKEEASANGNFDSEDRVIRRSSVTLWQKLEVLLTMIVRQKRE